MQDNESVLLTAEGKNGKIELTEASVRVSEYKKGLLGWDKSKIDKVHETSRDVVGSARVSPLTSEFYIDFPVDGYDKCFTMSFDEDYRQQFKKVTDVFTIHWYDDDTKLSNILSYDNEEKASIDANKAARKGWVPQSTSATDGHINLGRTVGKTY